METSHSLVQPRKYFSISSLGKRSIPAGTGVWVVKMVAARTASIASAKLEPLLHDEPAHPLQAEKAGVALVGVEHLGFLPDGVEGPDAADAEQYLLTDAVLGAPAVEAVGHRPEVALVVLGVGVEQVQPHPSDLGHPDLGDERLACHVDLHPGPLDQREGHGVRIDGGIPLLLPPVCVQDLPEVPLLVAQPHA